MTQVMDNRLKKDSLYRDEMFQIYCDVTGEKNPSNYKVGKFAKEHQFRYKQTTEKGRSVGLYVKRMDDISNDKLFAGDVITCDMTDEKTIREKYYCKFGWRPNTDQIDNVMKELGYEVYLKVEGNKYTKTFIRNH